MTRETRIALLVGLAFIVLFAMVLSQRSLNLNPHAPALASGATPQVPTPTVGPEVAMGRVTEDYDDPSVLAPGRLPLPGSRGGAPTLASTATPARPTGAGASGGTVIVAEGPTRPPTIASRPTTSTRPAVVPAAVIAGSKPHTIAQGETLAKIAKTEYGSDKDWERIFDANKDKLKSPTAMKIGVVLMIPPAREREVTATPAVGGTSGGGTSGTTVTGGAGTTGTAGTTGGTGTGVSGSGTTGSAGTIMMPLPPGLHLTPEDTADLTAGKTYVVKPGDSLALIAKRVMGDGPTAVKKLVALNRIDDPSRLRPGQTLRIPS